jgi:hypothetical protein
MMLVTMRYFRSVSHQVWLWLCDVTHLHLFLSLFDLFFVDYHRHRYAPGRVKNVTCRPALQPSGRVSMTISQRLTSYRAVHRALASGTPQTVSMARDGQVKSGGDHPLSDHEIDLVVQVKQHI